ncbi:hypothetical protein [Desulfonema magnum]|uniref:Uncharacterized protein n=1 Tax=Desulfonema magnum TaxID=45655 RepID=A0A975BKZ9_9BACT|nr:hypothetical protein [Desulfonema magnum]QTA87048.1 Uncharacterized protein dnm_030750 [Desulfonema magnum]
MLGEFTEAERLREQERLHQEWLRDQRSAERAVREKTEKLMTEIRLRKKAEAEIRAETEKIKAETEKIKAKTEKIKAKTALNEKGAVLGLRKAGYSDEEIAEILEMPASVVRKYGL